MEFKKFLIGCVCASVINKNNFVGIFYGGVNDVLIEYGNVLCFVIGGNDK